MTVGICDLIYADETAAKPAAVFLRDKRTNHRVDVRYIRNRTYNRKHRR